MRKVFVLVCSWLLLHAVAFPQQEISLAGQWRFAMDEKDEGIAQQWFSKKLTDAVQLPGSMLTNHKGNDVTLHTKWTGSIYDSSWFFIPRFEKYRQPGNLKFPFWLTPEKYYAGAAWYQKEIVIPAGWKNNAVTLFLERCHITTMVWVDGVLIGSQNSLVAPHVYDLGKKAAPGKHTITIRVDNRIGEINVGEDSHSVTDHTQGNWNGIIGSIALRQQQEVIIRDIQLYPDIENKQVKVLLQLDGNTRALQQLECYAISQRALIKTTKTRVPATAGKTQYKIVLPMGNRIFLWDEFNPALYGLNLSLQFRNGRSFEKRVMFGMRTFATSGTHFTCNQQPVFLRGTVDCCVFPLTGYPPATVSEWLKVFTAAKSHGLNHMRFHSWCPPEAAFEAADIAGFYLQPEAPTWPNHGVTLGDGKPIDQYIYDETNRMVQAYGNHPSFCMLAAGNEPAGKNQAKYLAGFIQYWQQKDKRRVYTGASVGMSWPLVPENEYMVKSGARNLNWTNAAPENISDYTAAIEKFNVPYVTHEMGQWCVFPDFTEIPKYTGVYKAKNFEMFRDDLGAQGMGDEAAAFHLASGKLQALCYKNEIEKTLRTKALGGFQLLGLQDFPGQGTALVGTVNPFWEDKAYMNEFAFRRFCNTTVPLIRTTKFVYSNNETFKAGVEIFHYGSSDLQQETVHWYLKDNTGKLLQQGKFAAKNIVRGTNTFTGDIEIPLQSFTKAVQLNLTVATESSGYFNDWNIWVYPVMRPSLPGNDIYYTDTLDAKAETILNNGGKVFLNLAGKIVKGKEVVQHFLPVFWNTSWFKMRPPHTTGILVNEKHPAFSDFPTSFHSDIQWWEIVNKAQVMHLENFPKDFKPLIRPIDTWFMNRRLALLFEANAGKGKLVVSSADLSASLQNKPAAAQLFYSLQQYMRSDAFAPVNTIDINLIRELSRTPSVFVFDAYTKGSPDELKPKPVAQ